MKYKIIYQKEEKIHTLKSNTLENLPKNIIKIKQKKEFFHFQFSKEYKKDILEMFVQLNIMLNVNLTLGEAINLSIKTQQSKIVKEILQTIQNAITSGKPIDKSLQVYKKMIGEVPILFVKLGIENGNIKQSIDSLVKILQEDIQTTTKLNDTLRYPKILIFSLLVSIGMIFIYVVPNFKYIFTMSQNQIPFATKILIEINYIVVNYYYVIFIGFISVIFSLYFLYQKFTLSFHKFIILYIPIVNRVLKDYYFYRLFLLISVIINSKYQFQIAVENSKNLISNLYIKGLIETIIINIKNGVSISRAFEKTKLFDSLTIKLLYTAEQTGQYEMILQDIVTYYQQRFQKSLKLFSSYLEPIIIFIIALFVLWLMLAIMLPIWDMSSYLS